MNEFKGRAPIETISTALEQLPSWCTVAGSLFLVPDAALSGEQKHPKQPKTTKETSNQKLPRPYLNIGLDYRFRVVHQAVPRKQVAGVRRLARGCAS